MIALKNNIYTDIYYSSIRSNTLEHTIYTHSFLFDLLAFQYCNQKQRKKNKIKEQ